MSVEIRIVGADEIRDEFAARFGDDEQLEAVGWLRLLLISIRRKLADSSLREELFTEETMRTIFLIERYCAIATEERCETFRRDVANSATAIIALVCCSDGDISCGSPAELLTRALSRVLANCSGSTAGNAPDKELRFSPKKAEQVACATCEQEHRVMVGFTGYAEGETGARLWAGATALSVYITEHFHSIFLPTRKTEFRVLEIGCGPGLVSCTLLHLIGLHAASGTFHVDVTDVAPCVVEEARRSVFERNKFRMEPDRLRVNFFTLDFTCVDVSLRGKYDLVVASDVVYDHYLSTFVAPAIAHVLSPGGEALVCCERHRDGMSTFVPSIRQSPESELDVIEDKDDVALLLQRFAIPPWLSSSTCALIRLRRKI